jgi:hypothetical protein
MLPHAPYATPHAYIQIYELACKRIVIASRHTLYHLYNSRQHKESNIQAGWTVPRPDRAAVPHGLRPKA